MGSEGACLTALAVDGTETGTGSVGVGSTSAGSAAAGVGVGAGPTFVALERHSMTR
ncbi:hypothetical protein MPL3356_30047 [Mesorhizobium plurifarium]|uniref:Uncharacterized protein n=1 Tax=Mesorhizobium plurifarium TaxID=69974 RepID=A0A090DXI9_MESPL|nr:hypothetical protein MPL3356_30047 [Mesorhizobium plurifarium]